MTCEVAKTALEGAISTNAQDSLVRVSVARMLEMGWQLLGEVEHQAAEVALRQEQSVL